MSAHLAILSELTLVIGAAAVAVLVFQRLHLPIVLGYILAGLVVGPYVTGAVSNVRLVETLSELGIILLFFTIGLEFSIRTIARVGLPTLVTVLVEQGLIAIAAFAAGRALGWTGTEAVFVAVGVGIASTMLVVKGLEEHRIAGVEAELILAIMVVEDLLSILLLAVMTGVATGSNLSAGDLAVTLAQLGGFLVGMVVIGLLIVPRAIRMAAGSGRPEPLLVTSMAVCFGMVWVAVRAGYSVALGAFVAGMLIAESGKGHDVDALIRPFRDLFAAIFFLSIGMTIDPRMIAEHWPAAVVVAVVLVVVKTTGVTIAAFLTGNRLQRSIRAGLSLSQIGEFAFIVVGVGVHAGVVREELLPIVVGASCITAMSGSLQIRASGQFANWIDGRLPKSIGTFVTFYESWIAHFRSAPRTDTVWRRLRKPLIVLVVDAALVVTIVIGTAVGWRPIVDELADRGIEPWLGEAGLLVVAGLGTGLFLIAIARGAVRIAHLIAAQIIPTADEASLPDAARAVSLARPPVDLGRAPRRVLILVLELAIVLVVGLPIAALTQPFVPGGGLVVLAVIVVLAFAARRSITDFHSHVRAGTALIVEILARQSTERTLVPDPAPTSLAEVEAVLPGFGGITPIVVPDGAPAVGRSLAELDLRARTGASVLALTRDGVGIASPSPHEPLRAGDVLAIAGSTDAVAAARALLVDQVVE